MSRPHLPVPPRELMLFRSPLLPAARGGRGAPPPPSHLRYSRLTTRSAKALSPSRTFRLALFTFGMRLSPYLISFFLTSFVFDVFRYRCLTLLSFTVLFSFEPFLGWPMGVEPTPRDPQSRMRPAHSGHHQRQVTEVTKGTEDIRSLEGRFPISSAPDLFCYCYLPLWMPSVTDVFRYGTL